MILSHHCLSILGGNLENFGGEISPPNSSEINTAYIYNINRSILCVHKPGFLMPGHKCKS